MLAGLCSIRLRWEHTTTVSTLGSHLGDVAQSTARVQRCVVHLPVLVSLIVQLLLLVDIIEMLAGGSLVD